MKQDFLRIASVFPVIYSTDKALPVPRPNK